eukprot:1160808-Pelagomonas_calceolata.AAC.16
MAPKRTRLTSSIRFLAYPGCQHACCTPVFKLHGLCLGDQAIELPEQRQEDIGVRACALRETG